MTTGQQIWDRALELADLTGSGFPDAVNQGLRHVNDALSELHYHLASSGADWYYSEATQALAVGTGSYTLPATFYRMLRVYLTVDGRNYPVRKFSRGDIAGAKSSPQTTGTLTLCFVPTFTALTVITGTIDATMPLGWEEYAALVIAVKLLIKQEQDARSLMAERDRKLSQLMDQAIPRDEGDAVVVEDVYQRWNGQPSDVNANRLQYRVQGSKLYIYDLETV